MKKRKCKRFTIPGATLFYKKRGFFFYKTKYSENYFPVLDMSKGGASFLTDQRIKPGSVLMVKLTIPDVDLSYEILCTARWVARNREESYRFQTGISFNTYGDNKNQNRPEVFEMLNKLEENFTKL
ncbi:MAG: PilZ domain-containing protein [Desulfobacteraceae bacterium]|nr:PilZ domain-containing protein [Desulfobacteraceae bacterium]